MKIQFFVRGSGPSDDDLLAIKRLRESGNKVMLSNGDFKKGFQVSCDAVYLAGNFPHIEKWATSSGIEVIKPAEPKPEPKPAANPAAKRGPKPKAKPEPTEPVADDKPTDEEGAE